MDGVVQCFSAEMAAVCPCQSAWSLHASLPLWLTWQCMDCSRQCRGCCTGIEWLSSQQTHCHCSVSPSCCLLLRVCLAVWCLFSAHSRMHHLVACGNVCLLAVLSRSAVRIVFEGYQAPWHVLISVAVRLSLDLVSDSTPARVSTVFCCGPRSALQCSAVKL
jgi:hypothetical protein